MRKILIIFLGLILFSVQSLKAEEGQFRFGVELGWTPIEIEAEKTAQAIANASGSTVLTEYDKGAIVGRLFGEYGISSNLGVEVGYFQTSGAGATYKIGADSASETYDISGIDIAAVFKSPEGMFGKVGMHSSTIDGAANVTIGSTSYVATASKTGAGALIGGGFESGNTRYSITHYADIGGIDTSATFFAVGYLF
ncbi:hypothetical protein N9O17_00665 [Candidatus Pelagibacter sp.]|nr:hypothetical protein [Candidatus Pelagibacter sp.]